MTRPRQRIAEALRAIDASLPAETDPGIYYDNARRRADAIRSLIDAESDPEALRILRRALDLAEYVGD